MATHMQNTANTQAGFTGAEILDLRLPPTPLTPAKLDHDWLLSLVGKLQSTLDVEELIHLFTTECTSLIRHDHFEFRNEERDLAFSSGRAARHSCSYRLRERDQVLGELRLTREIRFSEKELETIEQLLSHLIYPLRNALLYHQAVHAATHDPLTGLKNRRSLDEFLNREVSLSKRHGRALSVIMVDIDHFKSVNDRFGHASGDEALRAVASNINAAVRTTDIAFRFGGEEFAVLLHDTTPDGALLLAERIRQTVNARPLSLDGAEITLSVSAGVSSLSGAESAELLLKRADDALYRSKQDGRNRVTAAAN